MFEDIASRLSQRGHKQKQISQPTNTPTTKLTTENQKI